MEPDSGVSMDPALFEVFEFGSPDDEVGVIIRMEPGAEPPPFVRVVCRFDDIFTARLRRGDIVRARQSPGVISLKASTMVTQPRGIENAGAAVMANAEEDFETEDFETEDIEAEDIEAEDVDIEDVESEDVEQEDIETDTIDREADEVDASPASTNPALPSIPEDGRDVVVGICDWGFDFTHPNFRNPDGTTRLLSLWDQRGFGDPLAPPPYNNGRVLTREAINAALATPDPFETLGYHPASGDPTDEGSHGCHVADIVAGNRREPGSEVGLATAADIVFVHLAAPRLGELGNLGDSVGLLEGLDFCRRQAAGRPCVLHLSAGKTGGEKRGQSPLERAVDTMLKQPGIVLVQSVGNYAHTAMHTQARVGPDQRYVVNWIIPRGDRTSNELELWYNGEDVFESTLIAPDGREFSVPLDRRLRLEGEGTVWGNFYHRLHEPNSGLNHIAIYLYPAAPSGMWRVAVYGRDIVDGRLHAWIERDARRRFQSRFLRAQASSRFTTNTICNCFRAIAVGAYDATRRDRPGTRFSSRGPTADGRQKPELVAPGYMIRAARSTPQRGWQTNESRLCVKSGTSMAAPWVSGTVALMMQAAGRPLTVHEIRRALIGSADPHPGPKGRSSSKLGYGYLNTAAAVAAARRLGLPNQQPAAVSRQQHAGAPPRETESEDVGWAPVWADDGVLPAEIDTPVSIESDVEGDIERGEDEHIEIVPSINLEPGCSCGGPRKPAPPPERSRTSDRGSEGWEDEDAERLDTFEDEAGQIEAPFGWEDVRDALDAFDASEEPA